MSSPAFDEQIAQEVEALLRRHPPEEVARTLPVMMLALVRDLGLQALLPDMRAEVLRLAEHLGLAEGMAEEELVARTQCFVDHAGASAELLAQLEEIHRRHAQRLARKHGRNYGQLVQAELHLRAPEANAPRAPGSSRPGELLQRATGRLFLR